MNISQKDIKRQYEHAKAEGWIPLFEDMAERYGTSTSHFLAIGSRETNLKNIKGDFRDGKYHGFGVMQVDIGTDPEYAKEWSPKNARAGILRGGEIYQSKVNQIAQGQGKTLSVRGIKRFVGKEVEADDLRRIATAAYNCGLWAYYHFSNGEHVDSTTTGKDYSRDVYDRAIGFAQLRQADGEADALEHEIEYQGKYAREEHKKLYVTDRPAPDPVEPTSEPKEEKPTVETVPSNPPVVEVKSTGVSWLTKISAALAPVTTFFTGVGLKIGGVTITRDVLIVFMICLTVSFAVGAWIYNRGKDREQERLKWSMDNLATEGKGNVIAKGST